MPSNTSTQDPQKSSYIPVVGTGHNGYKSRYDPDTNVVYENGEALLTTSHADVSQKRLKFFIPPGTRRFTVSLLTYLGSEESKAACRFNDTPISTAGDIDENNSVKRQNDVLERLINGEELVFYSPGGSGNLGISEPYQYDPFKSDIGGYLYINMLSSPGGLIKTLQTRVSVDEVIYRKWFANAKWNNQDNPDENIVHTVNGSSGGSDDESTTNTDDNGSMSDGTSVTLVSKSDDDDGNTSVKLKIKRPSSDITGKTNTTYWVGISVEEAASSGSGGSFVYITPTGQKSSGTFDKDLLAFLKETTPPKAETILDIPLGLKLCSDCECLIQVHFAYSSSSSSDIGILHYKGVVVKNH